MKMENDSLWEMLFFISIVGLAHLSSLTIEVIFISKMFPTRLEEAKLVIGDHPSQWAPIKNYSRSHHQAEGKNISDN